MEKKMTKREYFATLRAIVVDDTTIQNREDILAFIDHEVELLNKKSSSRMPSKTQVENENLKAVITEVLAEIGKPVTITELMKDERLATYTIGEDVKVMTNQKLSAIIKRMPNVVRTEEKKKAYFSLTE
jgi:hypothetical protein